MSILSTTKMTARQFLHLGEDPPGVRLELIDGEIAASPSPTPEHSHIDTQLRIALGHHIATNKLGLLFGDVDTIFGEHDVRRPDILYFSNKRLHLIGDKAMEGPPNLCIEIISPLSSTIDRNDKSRQYAAGGVAFYWIVEPKLKTIEAYRLSGRRYKPAGRGQGTDVISLPPFPDLRISLGQIWYPSRRK